MENGASCGAFWYSMILSALTMLVSTSDSIVTNLLSMPVMLSA
jgi:hypothetical protein